MKNKLKLMTLFLTTGIFASSCGSKDVIANELSIPVKEPILSNKEVELEEEILEEDVRDIYDATKKIYLKTNTACNLREGKSLESKVHLVLAPNTSFEEFYLEGDWYRVNYEGEYFYIHKSCVEFTYKCEFPYAPIKRVYLKEDTTLVLDDAYKEDIILPKYEVCDVYEEYDGIYMVEVDGNVGFISKENTEYLTGTYVVVDISDQELNLYDNLDVVLTSPVVTGTPTKERESDIGSFEIYAITHNRDLVGLDYRSYVDVMMSYNRGEGLHDAEYHTNPDGKKHGWRDISEFGGTTYLTNGSHGCINMPHDNAIAVSEIVEVGTKVLVKK